MHICVTNDIVENYLSLAHNCKLNMKHAKFGIIDQHMNATCYMQYLSTLASSMLIILFSKMLKFQILFLPNQKILWRKIMNI